MPSPTSTANKEREAKAQTLFQIQFVRFRMFLSSNHTTNAKVNTRDIHALFLVRFFKEIAPPEASTGAAGAGSFFFPFSFSEVSFFSVGFFSAGFFSAAAALSFFSAAASFFAGAAEAGADAGAAETGAESVFGSFGRG